MVNKPIKSQPNRFLRRKLFKYFFHFFSILVSMATNHKSIASDHFIIWKTVSTGILNSPVKWRDNRVKVDKILSILAIL